MRRITLAFCLLSLTALAGTATADPDGYRGDDRGYRGDDDDRHDRELRRDRRRARDDAYDRAFLEELVSRFDEARAARDRLAIRDIDDQFLEAIRDEIAETSREIRASRRELRRSQREGRGDEYDDHRDLIAEKRALDATIRLANQYERLIGRRGWRVANRKRALLVRAIDLADFEQRENRREFREDRRESRFRD